MLAESLDMAAAHTTADAVGCESSGTWHRDSRAHMAVPADTAAGAEGWDSPGTWRSSSPRHRAPVGSRPLGVTLPHSSSTSKARRATEEVAAAASWSRAGRVTGSSRPVSSSGLFGCSKQPRESDTASEVRCWTDVQGRNPKHAYRQHWMH